MEEEEVTIGADDGPRSLSEDLLEAEAEALKELTASGAAVDTSGESGALDVAVGDGSSSSISKESGLATAEGPTTSPDTSSEGGREWRKSMKELNY